MTMGADWIARRAAHEARVRAWTMPHQQRRSRGEAHPVLDFLFTYYSFSPARLLRWHPGPGVTLTGEEAREYLQWPAYRETAGGVALDARAFPDSRKRTAEFVHALLSATAARAPRLGCFGLHEWAMVYRQSDERRHQRWPLRLGESGTDAVVESLPIQCSHFDAYRFFTEEARPLNRLRPTRPTQVELEQPGCLHASMDLYKWAYKLEMYVPSELIADCFALAVDARVLDMRASPYDLTDLGYTPVRIETTQGRAQYRTAQAKLAERAVPLRARLLDAVALLLEARTPHASSGPDRR